MTCEKYVTIFCDAQSSQYCEGNIQTGSHTNTGARDEGRHSDWVKIGHYDVCPDCYRQLLIHYPSKEHSSVIATLVDDRA